MILHIKGLTLPRLARNSSTPTLGLTLLCGCVAKNCCQTHEDGKRWGERNAILLIQTLAERIEPATRHHLTEPLEPSHRSHRRATNRWLTSDIAWYASPALGHRLTPSGRSSCGPGWAPFAHHLRKVTIAQTGSQVPAYTQQDNIPLVMSPFGGVAAVSQDHALGLSVNWGSR